MSRAGSPPMTPVDVASKPGLRFPARGDLDLTVMVFATSLGRIPATKRVHAVDGLSLDGEQRPWKLRVFGPQTWGQRP